VFMITASPIEFKVIDSDELARIQNLHFEKAFANRIAMTHHDLSNEDKALISERRKQHQPWSLIVGAYSGSEAIGWHVGYATDPETYYMKNSAVVAEYRNQGVYSKMLDFVLDEIKRAGFQVATSIHHGNNPSVLIPKLKKGFVISGTQFHEKFRFLVELKLFFSEERKKAYGKSMGLEL
ncbi:MAG: GNAT family N-acetyltransferase, partial [Bacillota bacterium]